MLLKLNVLVLLQMKNLPMKIIPIWKLQRKVTADLKKTVRIFIKCTDILYTQNMDQNSIIVGSKML